jgi:hypothetical protein
MTACVDSSFFDSCPNLALLNLLCPQLYEDCFLDHFYFFPICFTPRTCMTIFCSIMPVWQPAIVSVISGGVFLRVMSLIETSLHVVFKSPEEILD